MVQVSFSWIFLLNNKRPRFMVRGFSPCWPKVPFLPCYFFQSISFSWISCHDLEIITRASACRFSHGHPAGNSRERTFPETGWRLWVSCKRLQELQMSQWTLHSVCEQHAICFCLFIHNEVHQPLLNAMFVKRTQGDMSVYMIYDLLSNISHTSNIRSTTALGKFQNHRVGQNLQYKTHPKFRHTF